MNVRDLPGRPAARPANHRTFYETSLGKTGSLILLSEPTCFDSTVGTADVKVGA